MINLPQDLNLNIRLRYVDAVNAVYLGSASGWYDIDAYTTLDLHLPWRPGARVELSLLGQNLLESDHLEFVQESFPRPTAVGRGVFGKMTYTL